MSRFFTGFAKPHLAFACFISAGEGDTAANGDVLVRAGATRQRLVP